MVNDGRWPKRVVELAFQPRGSTPKELSAFVKEQLEVWRSIVGQVGIKPE